MESAKSLATQIKIETPGTIVLFNQLPKKWWPKEIYFQLIPNEDKKREVYDILPRLGAFEVSTVSTTKEGVMTDVLFYSKILSSAWPNNKTLTAKITRYFED